MNRELTLQFDFHQQEYERELKQLSFFKRLQRERREAREEQRRARQTRTPAPAGITL